LIGGIVSLHGGLVSVCFLLDAADAFAAAACGVLFCFFVVVFCFLFIGLYVFFVLFCFLLVLFCFFVVGVFLFCSVSVGVYGLLVGVYLLLMFLYLSIVCSGKACSSSGFVIVYGGLGFLFVVLISLYVSLVGFYFSIGVIFKFAFVVVFFLYFCGYGLELCCLGFYKVLEVSEGDFFPLVGVCGGLVFLAEGIDVFLVSIGESFVVVCPVGVYGAVSLLFLLVCCF
jgi:hypothetical protein